MRSGMVLAALVITAPMTLQAQGNSMPSGVWRGWLQQGENDSIRVSYQVQATGKHILITMRGRSGVSYDMADTKLKDDVLTFDWDLGLNSILFCRLSRRNGRDFEGICNDRSPGETGQPLRVWMLMTAPDSAR